MSKKTVITVVITFVGVEDVLNFQTLWYQTEWQPDAPLTFTLTLRATRSGRHNAGIAA